MTKPAPDLFSVPRRFDLFTMLVAAAAYAVLFTTLKVMNSPPSMMAFTGGLFTVVAIGQAIGHGRWNPRRSSQVAAGAYYWIVLGVMQMAHSGYPAGLIAGILVSGLIFGVIFGFIVGYLVGVLVAGVFLVSYHLREGFSSRRASAASVYDEQDASPWDESVEADEANRIEPAAGKNPQIDVSP